MNILGIIPARYASTRFPGKPLHVIAGQSLIQRVIQRCQLAQTLREVIVATDAELAPDFVAVALRTIDVRIDAVRIDDDALIGNAAR